MEQKKKTSAKAQKDENTASLPARYIRQPYPVSAMQADLSTQQVRILVGMMQSIQDGVQRMFEQNKRDKDGQLLLFSDADLKDDHVNVEFKFSDIAERPDAYPDVETVARKFMDMVFRYEDKEAGEVTLSHFVDEVIYPEKDSGKRRNRIVFSFTRKQAKTVFNFTKYSRYLMSVAAGAKSKHTARLYMLFTSARGFEQNGSGIFHWYVGYDELRRMLGCDEKDKQDRWHRIRMKPYKHFKAYVLRTAQSELKALADEGKSDCWFEFTELPEGFDGEPQRFDFLIHLCETKKVEDKATVSHASPADNPEMTRWND